MINLRRVNLEVSDYTVHVTDQQQRQSTVQFRRSVNRLGNIGEMLQSGWDDDEFLEEESNAAEFNIEAGRSNISTET